MTTGDGGPPPQDQPQYGQPQYGQPQYGQPQYGQPQYGQPQYGPPAASPYGPAGGPGRAAFGAVGTALAVVGAVAVVLGLTALSWFDSGNSKFSDVHKVLDSVPANAVAGLADAYFSWLAWALLALTVIVAVAANAPSGAAGALRALGLLLGLAAAAITLFAIKLDATGTRGLSDYLKHARVAFYVAMAGFVVIGLGAAVGPRRT